jgi:DNA-binding transcriptional MerR regulator
LASQYKVHEFARLAGVTVRALHHYDRLGLLRPRRTGAGYRLYSESDLDRLQEIVALKSLGLRLNQIKLVLDRDASPLPDALRFHRGELEEKRRRLDCAIAAIEKAEKAIWPGKPAAKSILKRIIEAITVQENADFKRKYFTDDAWARLTELRKRSGPGSREQTREAWEELYRDVGAALGEDPESEKAHALAARWMKLCANSGNDDLGIRASHAKAWADRNNWPASEQKRMASFRLEQVSEFISTVIACGRRKYFTKEDWAKLMAHWRNSTPESRAQISLGWIELYRDVEACLGEDPASEKAQSLALRWAEMVEISTGGDSGIKLGYAKAWADRKHLPPALQQQASSLNVERIFRFIADASAASMTKYYSNEGWDKSIQQSTPDVRHQIGVAWMELFRDVQASLKEDPASEKAQALATRWTNLVDKSAGGDPAVKAAWRNIWNDGKHWPPLLQKSLGSFDLDRISNFMNAAMAQPEKR